MKARLVSACAASGLALLAVGAGNADAEPTAQPHAVVATAQREPVDAPDGSQDPPRDDSSDGLLAPAITLVAAGTACVLALRRFRRY
ncbi:hypothetical protein [Actinophytocola sp. KF-1]